MRVDFFTCRARLKQIAVRTLEQPGTRRLSFEAAQRERAEVGDDVVFFRDDDDWFAPDLAAALAYLPTADVYVWDPKRP